jgi:hypothetical protein
MVKALIDLSEYENWVLNMVKAQFDLGNKADAIRLIIQTFEEEFLEPELRPEFVEEMKKRSKEPVVKIKDFKKHFGLDKDV